MTRMKTNMLLVGLIVFFFCIPFLPWQVLMLTDLLLVRLVLLVCFLAAINISPQTGVLSLAVIALLFIERNKQKVKYLQQLMQQSTPESQAIQDIQTPETAPIQPPFNKPSTTTFHFSPQEDTGNNEFEPVALTIDQKQVLPTETSNGSDKAIKQLFNWINPESLQE